jgi:RNA polymerase sigma factor (TIGR02999 family)
METPVAGHLATLVGRAEAGEPAAKDALFAALYSELHRLAEHHLHRSGGQLTLSATTLLHEAYLDIASRETLAFPDRQRFLAYASRAMRGLIIDYVRTRRAQKRGGEITFTDVDHADVPQPTGAAELERLGYALDELSALDPALAELVDLKFFCGFSFGEVAGMRGVSERTVQRDWAKARVLLHGALSGDAGP